MKRIMGLVAVLVLASSAAQAQNTYKTIPVTGAFGASGTATILVYEDLAGTTEATSIEFNTSGLNASFPNTTTGWLAGVGGRLFLKVNHSPDTTWDVSMFSANSVSETGIIHETYSNEVIKLKYRASNHEGTYEGGTLVDGYTDPSLDAAYFGSYRWVVNSTTGDFDDLYVGGGSDDKTYSLVASGDDTQVPAWDYNNLVEIIYILGLTAGDDGKLSTDPTGDLFDGFNPALTADQAGNYGTTICFEVVTH
ncbi:MAG: hypothetical protein AB1454_14825 [Candidatus Auribacterota bacterium]